jgi:hypothetical protein
MRTRRAGGLALGCAIAMGACHRAPEEFSLPASSAEAIVAPSSGSKPDARPAQAPPLPARPEAACPADPEAPAAALPAAKLQIPDADPAPVTVEAEIAKSEHDSTHGLMYRTSMPEMHGMLFELERADHVFWMHNTCIPLDLLYIDGGHIVGIVESAPILNDDARSVGKMSNQVLELNAGFCKRHGVRIGQHVALSGKSG